MQEIIGRMPPWIIRWGMTILGTVIISAFAAASFIRSPDTITCEISITNAYAPVTISSEENTCIKALWIKDGDRVSKGEVLALLGNTEASCEEVRKARYTAQGIDTSLYLEKVLADLSSNEPVHLGELRNDYRHLLIAAKEYLLYKPRQDQEYQRRQELRLLAKQFLDRCDSWERLHVIKSPSAGRALFFKSWQKNSPLKEKESILAIERPAGSSAWSVMGKVPASQYTQLKQGQTVFIVADGFPAQEFGRLQGKIERIAPLPVNGLYTIGITLNKGLLSTAGKKISCPYDLNASGEIVLENKSLLQKLFQDVL